MDMDLKPRPQQPTNINVTGPGDEPTRSPLPDLSDDPFKPDEKPPVPPGPVVGKKNRKGRGKKVWLVLLILVLIGGTGAGVYFWQEQRVKNASAKLSSLENQVSDLESQLTELQSAEAAQEATANEQTQLSTDEAVIAAATASCNAQVDSSNQPLVFTIGTIGAQNKKVVYSEDKNFAQVRATCGTAQNPGNPQTFYVKHTGNNNWVTVYHNATAPDAATVQMYHIPTTFN